MILVIAFLNDGTIMTISKDRAKPSSHPDSWKLKENCHRYRIWTVFDAFHADFLLHHLRHHVLGGPLGLKTP